jgi:hypothetical protein
MADCQTQNAKKGCFGGSQKKNQRKNHQTIQRGEMASIRRKTQGVNTLRLLTKIKVSMRKKTVMREYQGVFQALIRVGVLTMIKVSMRKKALINKYQCVFQGLIWT